MADQSLKNLLVYVPSDYVDSFISSHTGTNGTSSDDYYNKLSFLMNGQVSTHGRLFGMTDTDVQKIGISSLPSGQTSIGAYLVSLGEDFDTLKGTLNGSVQAYVATAVSGLIAGAPATLDTLGEIAALLEGGSGVASFADLQAQVGPRPMVNTEGTGELAQYSGNLYDYAAYTFNYGKTTFTYTDTAVAGEYVTSVSESNGIISVSRAALPSREDTVVATQYVSGVSQSNGQITVTRANLPTLSVDSTAGAAGQYISALSVSDHEITATYTSLPSTTIAAQTGKYISALTQTNGEVSATFADLPTLSLGNNAALANQYISGLTVSGHTITASYTTLPTLSVASGSSTYLTVNDHEIGATISEISTTTGITHSTSNNVTTYTAGTETIGTGLITASNVYQRVHATEVYVADALTTLDARIGSVVASATNDLDSSITITDSGSYVSATIVQTDGELTTTGSSITFDVAKIYAELDSSMTITATENNISYGSATIAIADGKLDSANSSLTINRDNILAEASATTTSGTNADPIQVSVTEVNHKVTEVSVTFNDVSTLWETYTPA